MTLICVPWKIPAYVCGSKSLSLIKADFSKFDFLKVCKFIAVHLFFRKIPNPSCAWSMAALIMHKRVNSTSLVPFECCFTLGGIDLHYAGWTNSPLVWTSVKVSREGQVSVIFNNKWDSHWVKWSRKSASALGITVLWSLMEGWEELIRVRREMNESLQAAGFTILT